MLKEFLRIIWADWVARMSGSMSILFTILTLLFGNVYARVGFGVLAFVALFIAAYTVWAHERAEVGKLRDQIGCPELFLKYDKPGPGYIIDLSGFYLENQSDRIAFNVEIDSEVKVGTDGKSLVVLLWNKPSRPIRKDQPEPLEVKTAERRNGINYPVGGLRSDQMDSFFSRIKSADEVVVTLTCTDVQGRACPPRKFRVSRTDILSGSRIYCNPLPTVAVPTEIIRLSEQARLRATPLLSR